MQYKKINGISKPLSRIIYGCTTEAMMKGQNVNKLLDEIYALGINTFDTAENYGLSEVSLGNWMKERNNSNKVVVITKGCHPYDGVDRMTPEYLKQDIEQSFRRLQTDYIDIYLLHRDVLEVPVGPIVEVLNEPEGIKRKRIELNRQIKVLREAQKVIKKDPDLVSSIQVSVPDV